MMTMEQAHASIGEWVVYEAFGKPEDGVITGTSSTYVFVHFDGDRGSKACSPENLTLPARPKEA